MEEMKRTAKYTISRDRKDIYLKLKTMHGIELVADWALPKKRLPELKTTASERIKTPGKNTAHMWIMI